MSDKLSPADAKWVAKAREDFIQRVDGKEIAALRARAAKLEAALAGLVNRLDEIHEDPAYKSVWTLHQIHVGPYRGPTYVDAMAAARAALKDAPQ
jgi:hypothetical protein